MAKESGLNMRLYVSGYDLSGDANSLGAVGYTNELYDVTTLSDSSTARLLGKVDGTLTVNGYFDNAANKIHAVLAGTLARFLRLTLMFSSLSVLRLATRVTGLSRKKPSTTLTGVIQGRSRFIALLRLTATLPSLVK